MRLWGELAGRPQTLTSEALGDMKPPAYFTPKAAVNTLPCHFQSLLLALPGLPQEEEYGEAAALGPVMRLCEDTLVCVWVLPHRWVIEILL